MIRNGRLGTVRAVYAEVNWGRIETWHPAPVPFYDVGVLVDVGVYPLSLVTTMLGPARSVRAWGWELQPDRRTIDGTPFRIGSPDLIVAAIELDGGPVVRLTASFWVGLPVKQAGSMEFHGDDASLALGSFQDFDAVVEVGAYGESYAPVAHLRPAFHGTAWARGVAEMAGAIAEGRPHRASAELAAHVVDVLEAAAASMADGGRRIEIDFDLRDAGADAVGATNQRSVTSGRRDAELDLIRRPTPEELADTPAMHTANRAAWDEAAERYEGWFAESVERSGPVAATCSTSRSS